MKENILGIKGIDEPLPPCCNDDETCTDDAGLEEDPSLH